MKQFLFVMSILCSISIHAQDVIVKKDGSTILSKVLEVNTADIKYKKFSNQNGPTYTIGKTEVMSINYENGEKDIFNSTNENAEYNQGSNSSPRYIAAEPDGNNDRLVSLYNRHYSPTSALSKKKNTPYYLLIYGVKPSSVLSNKDIEVKLERTVSTITDFEYEHIVYNISITNKTNKTLFVDKANCFKIFNDGTSVSYYENTEQITVSRGGGSNASIGLGSIAGVLGIGGIAGQLAGGINVGGGSSSSLSTTYNLQRIIAIPPHSKRNLTEEKYALGKEAKSFQNGEYIPVELAECFDYEELHSSEIVPPGGGSKVKFGDRKYFNLFLPRLLVRTGETVEYTEHNTPMSQTYIITYSTEEDFSTYSSTKIEIYLREIIGCGKLRKKNWVSGSARVLSGQYIEGIDEFTIEGYYNTEDMFR